MKWAKRVFLFMATNLLVIVTISIVMNILGIRPYLTANGIDYTSLMAFCLIWGMGGAFISLGLSRIMAKWTTGMQLIDPRRASGAERELLEMVYRLATAAGLKTMPEVGIYDSPEVNAFATGPTQNRSLVAVSSGLLHAMDRHEVEGVLAHEVAHVANGDMVAMTLIQGVMNAFVMFFARIIAFSVSQLVRDEDMQNVVRIVATIALDILLGILGSIVVAWFSRWREFRADAGGARLAGREKMVAALERLRQTVELTDNSQASLATMKISTRPSGFLALFSTHPPLELRIQTLKQSIIR